MGVADPMQESLSFSSGAELAFSNSFWEDTDYQGKKEDAKGQLATDELI